MPGTGPVPLVVWLEGHPCRVRPVSSLVVYSVSFEKRAPCESCVPYNDVLADRWPDTYATEPEIPPANPVSP